MSYYNQDLVIEQQNTITTLTAENAALKADVERLEHSNQWNDDQRCAWMKECFEHSDKVRELKAQLAAAEPDDATAHKLLSRLFPYGYSNEWVPTAKAALAMVTAPPQHAARVPEWQPIETAPKDGAYILICDFDGVVSNAKWDAHEEEWTSPSGDWLMGIITHWMPLPAAPTPPAQESKS